MPSWDAKYFYQQDVYMFNICIGCDKTNLELYISLHVLVT